MPPNCSIPPVSLVTNEIITITSAMRKNARWAGSGVAAILGGVGNGDVAGRWGLRGQRGENNANDNSLLNGFSRLRSEIADCKGTTHVLRKRKLKQLDITTFDTPTLLSPFLAVVQSSTTTGAITSLSLSALQKFFSYKIINSFSPRLPIAIHSLSTAITHCRFEASDSAQDEVVLLRILKLMEEVMTGCAGDVLSDGSVCEMMETGLSMCCQMRLSEMLRKSSEMAMVTMVQTCFEKLKTLPLNESVDESNTQKTLEVQFAKSARCDYKIYPSRSLVGVYFWCPELTAELFQNLDPYGLVSIRELLRVLISLLDPYAKQHTDSMRVMALRLIDVAFEIAGSTIAAHPSLSFLATDDLCRYLFQLIRTDTPHVLSHSLRLISTLLFTLRHKLLLQQELFLGYVVNCLHPKSDLPKEIDPILYDGIPLSPKVRLDNSGRSTPIPIKEQRRFGLEGGNRTSDARELMVECMGGLARIPSFMVDLFVNYDCVIDRSDLCEDIIGFLSRNAFPDAATWSTQNVPPLCLDALLAYIGFIADRLDSGGTPDKYPNLEALLSQRDRKQIIIKAALKFNENYKAAIPFLQEHGLVDDAASPPSMAKFLHENSRLNKSLVGEYLGKPANIEVLERFIKLFSFKGKRIDEALRRLLETFRLPGEAQQIDRIVDKFAAWYYESQEGETVIRSSSAAYVLTFATVMLNTDQHNPQVKKKMEFSDFAKNVRGVNDNEDFPDDFLLEIYAAIQTHEIIMPEEHDNQASFDHAWTELQYKSTGAGDLTICSETNIFDRPMFASTWKPVIATLSYVFTSATDDAVFHRVINGFNQCAEISSRFGLCDAMDHIVLCLSRITGLATKLTPSTRLNTTIDIEGNGVTVSELAVRLGRDFKAQLAMVVLFKICNGNEKFIRKGWKQIFRILLGLFINGLLPPSFSRINKHLQIDPIPLEPLELSGKKQTKNEGGFISAFTSYLSSYAVDEPPEPSSEEVECTLCTKDCVNSCRLDEVSGHLISLDLKSTKHLLNILLPYATTDPTRKFLSQKRTVDVNGPLPVTSSAETNYDASLVMIFEFATCLVLRDEQSLEELGNPVVEMLEGVIKNANRAHCVMIERCFRYLMAIFEKAGKDLEQVSILDIFDHISNWEVELQVQLCSTVLPLLQKALTINPRLAEHPSVFIILRNLLKHQSTVDVVFTLVKDIIANNHVFQTTYVPLVELLDEITTMGEIGAKREQQLDTSPRRRKSGKVNDKPQVHTFPHILIY
ncbi:hypothetical protein NEOLI_002582 [Neolecta irregularis DAH-3]|uniref:SEC7 domain-containing protein n=1 Tax=Neolecta irregularis (strain DAH-3) TaxID=1198029 RepID=A0A1U7LU72_NEOID|nr:hypothetical protein NEOLI_002582 [Neolecta irregularis DAH-3]|eukprot:OLL26225.1 hypothetical protein NEOLI_002582 [Neolecta irregularis DAH-3]